jgi:hypothetical protein
LTGGWTLGPVPWTWKAGAVLVGLAPARFVMGPRAGGTVVYRWPVGVVRVMEPSGWLVVVQPQAGVSLMTWVRHEALLIRVEVRDLRRCPCRSRAVEPGAA